jgi:hypothetical protein
VETGVLMLHFICTAYEASSGKVLPSLQGPGESGNSQPGFDPRSWVMVPTYSGGCQFLAMSAQDPSWVGHGLLKMGRHLGVSPSESGACRTAGSQKTGHRLAGVSDNSRAGLSDLCL